MAFLGTGSKADPYIIHNWEEFELFASDVTIKNQNNLYVKWSDSDNKVVDFKNEEKCRIIHLNNICDMDFNGWTFKNIVTSWKGFVSKGITLESSQLTIVFGNQYSNSPIYIRNGTFIYDIFATDDYVTYNVDSSGNRTGFGNLVDYDDSGASYWQAQIRKPVFYFITRQNNHRNTIYLDRMNVYINWGSGDITVFESTCNYNRKVSNGNIITWEPQVNVAIYVYNSIISITHDKTPLDSIYTPDGSYYYYMCTPTTFINCEININMPVPKVSVYNKLTYGELQETKHLGLTLFAAHDSNISYNNFYYSTINIVTDDFVGLDKDVAVVLCAYSYNNSEVLQYSTVNFNDTNVISFMIFACAPQNLSSGRVRASGLIFSKNGKVWLKHPNISEPTGLSWIGDEYIQGYESLKSGYSIMPDKNFRIQPVNEFSTTINYLISNPLINNGKPIVPLVKYPLCSVTELNRSINAKISKQVPAHIKYQNSDVQFMYVEGGSGSPTWQPKFQALFNNQAYGNWLNPLEKLNDERNQRQIVSTFRQPLSETETNILTHIWDNSNKNPGNIITLNSLGYDNISGYSFEPRGLGALVLSDTDSDGLQCFEISKDYLNLLDFTIAVVCDTSKTNKTTTDENLHYLITLPILTDSNGRDIVFYIASKYENGNLVYVTNINEEMQETIIELNRAHMLDSSCDIFIITCNPISITLYANGLSCTSKVITDYTYKPAEVQNNGSIGYSNNNSWTNNFIGNILSIHLLSHCCNVQWVWNLFTKCRKMLFKKDETLDDSHKLLELSIHTLPTKLIYNQREPVNYDNIKVLAGFNDGMYDVTSEITYSIPNGSILDNWGEQEVVISYTYKGTTLTKTFNITVWAETPIQVTKLNPETFEFTDDVVCYTNIENAISYMKSNPTNLYDMTINDYTTIKTLNTSNQCANVSSLYSVYLPDSITEIGMSYFLNCTNLKKVRLSENLEILQDSCFRGTGLVSVELPNSLRYILNNAFYDCSSLQKVTCKNIKDVSLSPGTGIYSYAFGNCTNLEYVELPNSVKNLNQTNIFNGCSTLKTVVFPEYLESLGADMFKGCMSLTNIIIPESVTDLNANLFSESNIMEDAEGSTALYIGNWLIKLLDTTLENYAVREGTTGIAKFAMESTSNLQSLTLPTTLKRLCISSIRGSSLTELFIPSLQYVADSAINSCPNLVNVSLGKDYSAGFLPTMFNTGQVTIHPDNPLYSVKDDVIYDKNITKVLHVPNSLVMDNLEFPKSVTTIATHSIVDIKDKNIKTITLHEGITNIEDNGFSNCTSNIVVEGILRNFGKYTLANSTSSNLNITSLKLCVDELPPNAFKSMTKLESLDISGNLKVVPEGMCWGCSSLTHVTLPDSVETFESEAFYQCKKLQEVKLPKSLKILGRNAFCETGLTSIDIVGGVVGLGMNAFSLCPDLVNVTLPSTVLYVCSSAFYRINASATINIDRPTNFITGAPWGATNEMIRWLDS